MPSSTTQTPLDEALTLKANAEAEKFRQEAHAFESDHALKAAQAREALAKARQAEYQAENSRINTQANLRQERVVLAQNHHHHEFFFNDGVDDVTAAECVGQLAVWHRLDPTCDMIIKIDSPGGAIFDGFHLFDEISAYSLRTWDTRDIPTGSHKTTMIARGMAASMAGILLQAADHRVAGPEAWILIHEIQTYAVGKIGEIKEDVKFYTKVGDRVADIFVRRSGGRITKAAFKRRWDGKEWWLSSEEALALGFIDEIA